MDLRHLRRTRDRYLARQRSGDGGVDPHRARPAHALPMPDPLAH